MNFDFTGTPDGTLLGAVDGRFGGATTLLKVQGGKLVASSTFSGGLVWFANAQGDSQTTEWSLDFSGTVGGELAAPTIQSNGTQAGYRLELRADGDIDVIRNGTYVTRLTGGGARANPTVLKAVYVHTTGVITVFTGGVNRGSSPVDATPLVGGFPGLFLTNGSVALAPAVNNFNDGVAVVAAVLSSPGSSTVGSTTAIGLVTSDRAGGTMYAALTPTNVAPTAAQIKAGSGGGIVATSSGAAVSGVNTRPFTGLSTTTTYYAWFVQNNGADSNVPPSVSFTTTATAPTVSAVSTPSPANGANLTVTGIGFNATQAGGSVSIGGTVCAIVSWSGTSIVATVARGLNKYGAALNVVVTNGATGLSSSPYAGITGLTPQAGWSFTNLAAPNATAATRITAIADLAAGDQLAYDNKAGQVVVATDATFVADASVASFDVEAWTPADGWGATATQTLAGAAAAKPVAGFIWF